LRTNDQTLLVNWLSYAQAMPHAAAVVTHVGHGTLARALLNGVPVVAVPHSGDMGENAARVDWAGVGVRLPWRLLSATTVRLAVGRVLDREAAYADRARLLADWAAIHDGPTRACELVEQLGARQLQAQTLGPRLYS
jgi:UDP:flavonoid glycosyltransferase YjiC (YdhE family)